jgi:hypothetical protein
MSVLGPISTALEAELRQRVQQNGIVIWLDRDACHEQGDPLGGAFVSGLSLLGNMALRGGPSC